MRRNIEYCYNCDKEVVFKTTVRKEVMIVRGADIEVNATVAICPYCKDDLFHEPYDNKNIEEAYKKYEQIYGLNPRE